MNTLFHEKVDKFMKSSVEMSLEETLWSRKLDGWIIKPRLRQETKFTPQSES
jgi:hypothetical protein